MPFARGRIGPVLPSMAARYPWYLLADSGEGRYKEADLRSVFCLTHPFTTTFRQGFIYERVPY